MTGIGPVRSALIVVALSLGSAKTASAADATEIIGAWKLKYEPGDGRTYEPVLTISREGADLKGRLASDGRESPVKDLQFKDGSLRFRWEGEYEGEPIAVDYECEVEGDVIEGTGRWSRQGESGDFPFAGKRSPVPPAIEASAAKVIPIWPGVAPGSEKWDWSEKSSVSASGMPMATDVVRPVLLHYPADKDKAVGSAMIVAPGGGFRVLMMSYEGVDIARRLNAMGVDAFVLKYRLVHNAPGAPTAEEVIKLAGADGRQALKVARERAAEFGYRADRVGMIGFSAGGMVTADALYGPAESRPNFAAIIYGARELKETPSPAPPLFLAVSADDAMSVGRTIDLFNAYRKGKGAAELHVFQMGAHGFVNKGGGADRFMDRLEEWLRVNKLLATDQAHPGASGGAQ